MNWQEQMEVVEACITDVTDDPEIQVDMRAWAQRVIAADAPGQEERPEDWEDAMTGFVGGWRAARRRYDLSAKAR